MTDRVRPPRRPIVPRWLVPVSVGLLVVVLAFAGYGIWSASASKVTVPDLVGLDAGVATTQLAQGGLVGAVVENRFGSAAEDTVLEQSPQPGVEVAEGTTVELVVSAGSEEFEMPDVVGVSLRVAQAQLEQAGLSVKVDQVESDQPKDMVLATNPAPGATVRTADIVRLTVAAESDSSSATLPYRMDGVTVVLDPSGVTSATVDAPMEVARRLQSLLEASGAEVIVTRSASSTDISAPARAEAASESSASVVVGFDIATTGQAGFGVVTLPVSAIPDAFAASTSLAEVLAEELSAGDAPVTRTITPSDVVLEAAATVGVRVRLGSAADSGDLAAFRDPTWGDTAARAVYRALGARFGTR